MFNMSPKKIIRHFQGCLLPPEVSFIKKYDIFEKMSSILRLFINIFQKITRESFSRYIFEIMIKTLSTPFEPKFLSDRTERLHSAPGSQ